MTRSTTISFWGKRLGGKRPRRQDGLTLVELMVTVLLASMLSGGLFYVMAGQTTTYSSQVSGMVAQENLWGAMEYLQRQIRLAGYGFGGCRQPLTKAGVPPVVAFRAYNNCDLYKSNPSSCPVGVGASTDGADAFTIVTADIDGALAGVPSMRLAGDTLTGSAPVCLKQYTGTKWAACDWMILWRQDTNECSLLMVSDIVATPCGSADPGLVLNTTAGGCGGEAAIYNPPPFPTGGFPATSTAVRIGKLEPRHFAVDRSANPPRLVTWTSRDANPSSQNTNNFEIVADEVEDLQIAWACDADDNNAFDEGQTDADKRTDDWFSNVKDDNAPNCAAAGKTFEAVRITIVSRSASRQPHIRGRRPAAEDRPAGPIETGGGFQRRALTATIRMRNLR